MRRPKLVLSTSLAAIGLSASVALAQQSSQGQVGSSAPTSASAASLDPSLASRPIRSLLRNGMDYLAYQEYSRALTFLKAVEARQAELNPAEVQSLKKAISQAQQGLRAAVNDPKGVVVSKGRKVTQPGAIALANGVPASSTSDTPVASRTGPKLPTPLARNAALPDPAVSPASAQVVSAAPVASTPMPTQSPASLPSAPSDAPVSDPATRPSSATAIDLPPLPDGPGSGTPASLPDLPPPTMVPTSAAPATSTPASEAPEQKPVAAPSTATPATSAPVDLPPPVPTALPDGPPPPLVVELPEPATASSPTPAPVQTNPAPRQVELPAVETAPAPTSPAPASPVPTSDLPPLPAEASPVPSMPPGGQDQPRAVVAEGAQRPVAEAPATEPAVPATTPPEPPPAPEAPPTSPAPSSLPGDTSLPPSAGSNVVPSMPPYPSTTGRIVPSEADVQPILTAEQRRELEEKFRNDTRVAQGPARGGAGPGTGAQLIDPNDPSSAPPASGSPRLEIQRAPSPTEGRPLRQIPIPEEFVPLGKREWEPNRKYWAAAGTCHMILYFQDPVLERYGQGVEQSMGRWGRYFSYPLDDPRQSNQRNQILQPFYSMGKLCFQVGTLPYKMVVDPPWEAEYDLGYYRPGDKIPADTIMITPYGVGPPLKGRNY